MAAKVTFAVLMRVGASFFSIVNVVRTDDGFDITTANGGSVEDPFGQRYVTLNSVNSQVRNLIRQGALTSGRADQIPNGWAKVSPKGGMTLAQGIGHMAVVSDKPAFGYASKSDQLADAVRMVTQLAEMYGAEDVESELDALKAEIAR